MGKKVEISLTCDCCGIGIDAHSRGASVIEAHLSGGGSTDKVFSIRMASGKTAPMVNSSETCLCEKCAESIAKQLRNVLNFALGHEFFPVSIGDENRCSTK